MTDIEQALLAFAPYVPANATLSIEETDCRLIARYLVRMTYTSARSGKQFTITSKGDNLPKLGDELTWHYTSQLILTPEEQAQKFGFMRWQEKIARQDAWLFGGGKERGNDVRVVSEADKEDYLPYEQWAGIE